jgi:hypothetical protein
MLCEIYTKHGLVADEFSTPDAAKRHADRILPKGEEIVIQAPAWKLWFAVAGEEGLTLGGRLPKWPLKKPAAGLASKPGLNPLAR